MAIINTIQKTSKTRNCTRSGWAGERVVEGWRGRGVLNTCGQGSSFGSSTTSHGTRQSRTMLIILTARLWVSFQSLQCLLCYSQTSGFQSLYDFSGWCIKDFPTHPINSRRGTTVTGDMGFQGTQLVWLSNLVHLFPLEVISLEIVVRWLQLLLR